MKVQKRIFLFMRIFLLVFLCVSVASPTTVFAGPAGAGFPVEPPPTPTSPQAEQVEQAVYNAIAGQAPNVLGYLLYQVRIGKTAFSEDGAWAVSWMGFYDADLGGMLPIEPGLAVSQKTPEGWRVWLPSDPGWLEVVEGLPDELMPPDAKAGWRAMAGQAIPNTPQAEPFSGYLLPWAAGQTHYLSQSVGHDRFTPSGTEHFAYDFYAATVHWRVLAAKAGTVWMAKWTVPDCYDPNNPCIGDPKNPDYWGNYLVLRDTTTTPVTYQLYLHLAQNSIPEALRAPGAQVAQGQYLALANDTGQSWGEHLHFQVHEISNYWFGYAQDFVFSDVGINGGRPRYWPADKSSCLPADACSQTSQTYISQNIEHDAPNPPAGALLHPTTGDILQGGTLLVDGYANSAVAGAVITTLQARADYGGAWHDIGPGFSSSTFSYAWDVCSSQVPNGAVSVSFWARDSQGNTNPQVDIRHLTKDFDCGGIGVTPPPTPACLPVSGQVALFAQPNYAGNCSILGSGSYTNTASLGPVGGDTAASILVGLQSSATLFTGELLAGRRQTFITNTADFTGTLIGDSTASSLLVRSATLLPLTPTLVSPANGVALTWGDVDTFFWQDSGGATQFQGRIQGVSSILTSTWQADPVWMVDSLAPGSYTWKVRGRNPASTGAWSASRSFNISTPSVVTLPTPLPIPFNDTLEISPTLRWQGTGLWDLKTQPGLAHGGNNSWWYRNAGGNYDSGTANAGDLTLAPIAIPTPAGGNRIYLSFWYRSQTEDLSRHWDQRWLQVSVDGAPFKNVSQFSEDYRGVFGQSQKIDLSGYAGHAIRLRFHFDTLDALLNTSQAAGPLIKGWGLDDIDISSAAQPACNDTLEPNNTLAQASTLALNTMLNASICPGGDFDYYRFNAAANRPMYVQMSYPGGSTLAAAMYLYDSDGLTQLARNSQAVPGQGLQMGLILPHAGWYYVKVRASDNPQGGGPTATYRLLLTDDTQRPSVALSAPASGSLLAAPLTVQATASDAQSGISRVDFYTHSSDWQTGAWTLLKSDTNGVDGWNAALDPASLPEGTDLAVYAYAFDGAGNFSGAGAWSLLVDHTKPELFILQNPITHTVGTNAFHIQWTASDALAGLDHYDIQTRVGISSWVNYASGIPAAWQQAWVSGPAGSQLTAQVRAVDRAGNLGDFQPTSPVSIDPVFCNVVVGSEPANDTWSGASQITPDGSETFNNFCSIVGDKTNDMDWTWFAVTPGSRYMALVTPVAGSNNGAIQPRLELYTYQGTTLSLASVFTQSIGGQVSGVALTAPGGVTKMYLKVLQVDGRIAGQALIYTIKVYPLASTIYLPQIQR